MRYRLRSNSLPLNSVPPALTSGDYSTPLASLAARILYRSPLPSQNDLPIYILNAAAFPDSKTTNYDALLPYVLARLPNEEELIGGHGYEVVFFAGGGPNETTQPKKGRPSWGWFLQAYNVLTRATRKRLQTLYIVHEKNWIRVLVETFATVVSPKFRKKIVHVSTITGLALRIPIEDLLIPPSAYLTDRLKSPDIHAPYASGKRAFAVKQPLPASSDGSMRLPRVLRETTSFVIMDENIKTEGIFRVSARAQTVEILREAYDRGQKFIVWKEVNAVLAPSYWKKGTGDVGVEELDQAEGYELHVAAALIKLWYKELKEPIFPTSSYQALNKFYRSPEVLLEPPQLFAMLSENDEWSPISSRTSRKILIMHLLPLLSKVAESQDQNQMSPENLAVCFAPSLLCGPDPIEDLKISAIVRRILVAMIGHWKTGLAPMLHTDSAKFAESLRMSNAVEDREDPLEEAQTTHFDETQITGITLLDNDSSDEETESAPALPPRPRAATVDIGRLNGDIPTVPGFCRGSSFENSDEEIEKPPDLPSKARAMTFDRKCLNGSIPTISEFSRGSVSDTGSYDGTGHTRRKSSMVSNPVNSMIHSNNSVPQDSAPINVNHFNTTNPIRRKPAPSMLPLPRYSTIINDRPAAPEGIQYYNTVPLDSDERDEEDDINGLPSYEERVPIHKEPSHPVPPPPWNEPVIQRKPLPKSETGD